MTYVQFDQRTLDILHVEADIEAIMLHPRLSGYRITTLSWYWNYAEAA